jgi:hypothetical protein
MEIKNLLELQLKYGNDRIPYYELLTCQEWRYMRDFILTRDNKTCTKCGGKAPDDFVPKFTYVKDGEVKLFMAPVKWEVEEKDIETFVESANQSLPIPTLIVKQIELAGMIFLHVHHKYYVLNKLPWDYPESALTTVCANCHEAIHKAVTIPVYEESIGGNKKQVTRCSRCHGQGILPQYSYYMNGICFECWGAKYVELVRDFDRMF